jgi:feruloyl esterase
MIRLCRVGLLLSAGLSTSYLAQAQGLLSPDRAAAAQETACLSVNALDLPELETLEARWVEAGAPSIALGTQTPGEPIDLPAHCRVQGTVETAIRFEVWLPAPESWNGRFLGIGNTDDGGELGYVAMIPALREGYVTASTDTGHAAGDAGWRGDEAPLRDFGYRAIYEMTSKARAIVGAFYGRSADYRYFNGCSLGGRQGLMEAERFPEDYDGIVAGAPVAAFVGARATEIWALRSASPASGSSSLIGPAELALVNDAAIAQCDTFDGVLDGVLEDPRRCNFEPRRLQCAAVSGSRCLTPDQVTAFERIYSGPIDRASGQRILPGFAIGSERGWRFVGQTEPSRPTLEFFRRAVFDDPIWDWRRFDFAVDYPMAEEKAGWMLDATQTDLSAFRDRGAKLIVYQGWNDARNAPESTIGWYEGLEAEMAVATDPLGAGARDFARLFMVPGMDHCGGGPGASEFDAQHAIEDWVERGIAPDRIEAERVEDGQVVRTRPLCPYPQTARYRSGNTDRTGSFVCSN